MLLGTFAPKLDEKGRIILPAKFADDFSGGVVMARGQEHAIYVFSQREFENLRRADAAAGARRSARRAATTCACSSAARPRRSRTRSAA